VRWTGLWTTYRFSHALIRVSVRRSIFWWWRWVWSVGGGEISRGH
jgi:hypothetical protein